MYHWPFIQNNSWVDKGISFPIAVICKQVQFPACCGCVLLKAFQDVTFSENSMWKEWVKWNLGSRSWARRECTKLLFLHSDHRSNFSLETSSSPVPRIFHIHTKPFLSFSYKLMCLKIPEFSFFCLHYFFFFLNPSVFEKSHFIQSLNKAMSGKELMGQDKPISWNCTYRMGSSDSSRACDPTNVPHVIRATEFLRKNNQKSCLEWCKWEFITFSFT